MAITLTGAGGLFTRLGKIGKVADRMRTYQGTTLPAAVSELMAQYDTLRTAVDGVPTADVDSRAAVSSIMAKLREAAQKTLLEMVKADKPARAATVAEALRELIDQMETAAATVETNVVAASAAALSGNAGDGVLAVSKVRGDGRDQENLFPETAYVLCSDDSQTGSATEAREVFTYTGEPAVSDVWSDTYPIGSGVTTTLTAIDAAQDNSGNLLTNSDFEAFTANLPDNWSVLVGTAGTDFLKSVAEFFDGAASLQLVGGATLTSLAQTFDLAGGTAATLSPSTAYAVNFWAKVDDATATGELRVELVDGTNTVINDDQGVANAIVLDLAGLTTSWAPTTGFIRTPRALPETVKVRVRLSTALSAGDNLFVDRLAVAEAVALYDGGPLAAVFSGADRFVRDDGFTLTTTNDYGGASNLSTFQQLFERLYGMRSLGLVLPSAGAPTIADTLISA